MRSYRQQPQHRCRDPLEVGANLDRGTGSPQPNRGLPHDSTTRCSLSLARRCSCGSTRPPSPRHAFPKTIPSHLQRLHCSPHHLPPGSYRSNSSLSCSFDFSKRAPFPARERTWLFSTRLACPSRTPASSAFAVAGADFAAVLVRRNCRAASSSVGVATSSTTAGARTTRQTTKRRSQLQKPQARSTAPDYPSASTQSPSPSTRRSRASR